MIDRFELRSVLTAQPTMEFEAAPTAVLVEELLLLLIQLLAVRDVNLPAVNRDENQDGNRSNIVLRSAVLLRHHQTHF